MTIERIGPLNHLKNINKNKSVDKIKDRKISDSVNISKEAQKMTEISRVKEIVKNTPDIRPDKIEQAKKLISNPDFLSQQIAETIAEKIVDSFNLNQ